MNEDRLTQKLRRSAPLIGDDCAVLPASAKEDWLLTTDFTIEDVHFTRDLAPDQVGRRALLRGLSDIAAMGGRPRYCLVSLAAAPWTDERWIDGFYRGLLKLARKYKTELAGGDLSHASQLACDIVVCGAAPRGKALLRSGARPGDTIYVSGALGGWRVKTSPEPRLDLAAQLSGKATACMDITDGLALDLHRLCKASGVAAELEAIPVLPNASLEQALHDGEDYELLYTAPPNKRVPGLPIGAITAGRAGKLRYQGRELKARGYDHFAQRP